MRFLLAFIALIFLTFPSIAQPARVSTGTSFFVTNTGVAVTNAHVVDDCGEIAVRLMGAEYRRAARIFEDRNNDLALIRIEGDQAGMVPVVGLNMRPRLGEEAYVYGFPLGDMLSPNFTTGTITGLTGIRNDTTHLQIQTPVQPGNSGGAALDNRGNVIGVIVGKLNPLVGADLVIPENVNFAIRSQTLDAFLQSQNIILPVGQGGEKLDAAKIAELAKASTIKVFCKKRENPAIVKLICKMSDGFLKDRKLNFAIDLDSGTAASGSMKLKIVDANKSGTLRLATPQWVLEKTSMAYYLFAIDVDPTLSITATAWREAIPTIPSPKEVENAVVCQKRGNKNRYCGDDSDPRSWGAIPAIPVLPDKLPIDTASGTCERVP